MRFLHHHHNYSDAYVKLSPDKPSVSFHFVIVNIVVVLYAGLFFAEKKHYFVWLLMINPTIKDLAFYFYDAFHRVWPRCPVLNEEKKFIYFICLVSHDRFVSGEKTWVDVLMISISIDPIKMITRMTMTNLCYSSSICDMHNTTNWR